jgi:hypothetical protein
MSLANSLIVYQYSETNAMQFLFVSSELRASKCFEHYLLYLRRHHTNCTMYIACVLCQLAATELEWN